MAKSTRYTTAHLSALVCLLLIVTGTTFAGPPFASDDPAPTDYRRFEIYGFTGGSSSRDGQSGEAGIDFNYGPVADVQLTAVLPMAVEHAAGGPTVAGLGNAQLAVKYRFLHQDSFGWDVAVFPRVFLPSASDRVGDQHAAVFLPFWLGRSWDSWSTFGGGGCAINRGDNSQNYCVAGWVVAKQVTPKLQLGVEIFHQTADTTDGGDSTVFGTGLRYDLNALVHLLTYGNTGIQNEHDTQQYSWYGALLFTF